MSYRTYRFGYGYECPTAELTPEVLGTGPTELAEVVCRVIPGVNTSDMVLYVYGAPDWRRGTPYTLPENKKIS